MLLLLLFACAAVGCSGQDVQITRDVIVYEADKPVHNRGSSADPSRGTLGGPSRGTLGGPSQGTLGGPSQGTSEEGPSQSEKVQQVAQKFGISLIEELIQQGRSLVNRGQLENQANFYDQVNPEYANFLRNLPPQTYNAISGLNNRQKPQTGNEWFDLAQRTGNLAVGPPLVTSERDLKDGTITQGVSSVVQGLVPNVKPEYAISNQLFNQFLPGLVNPDSVTLPPEPHNDDGALAGEILTSLIPGVVTGLVALGRENQANEKLKQEAYDLTLKSLNPEQLKILAAYVERTGAKSINDIPLATLQRIALAKIQPKPEKKEKSENIRRKEPSKEKSSGPIEVITEPKDLQNRKGKSKGSGERFRTIRLNTARSGRLQPKSFEGDYLENLQKIAEARRDIYNSRKEKSREEKLVEKLDEHIPLVPKPVLRVPEKPKSKKERERNEESEATISIDTKTPKEDDTEKIPNEFDLELERIIAETTGKVEKRRFSNAQLSNMLKSNPVLLRQSSENLLNLADRFGVPRAQMAEVLQEMSVPVSDKATTGKLLSDPKVARLLNRGLQIGLPLIQKGLESGVLFSDQSGRRLPGSSTTEGHAFNDATQSFLGAFGDQGGGLGSLLSGLTRQKTGPGLLPPAAQRPPPPPTSIIDLLTGNQKPQNVPSDLELLKKQVTEYEQENRDLLTQAILAQAGPDFQLSDAPYDPLTGGGYANPILEMSQRAPGLYLNSFAKNHNNNVNRFALPYSQIGGNFGTKTTDILANSGSLVFPEDFLNGAPMKANVHSTKRNTEYGIADFNLPQ